VVQTAEQLHLRPKDLEGAQRLCVGALDGDFRPVRQSRSIDDTEAALSDDAVRLEVARQSEDFLRKGSRGEALTLLCLVISFERCS
jgi:hypothetical protein